MRRLNWRRTGEVIGNESTGGIDIGASSRGAPGVIEEDYPEAQLEVTLVMDNY